MVVLFTPLQGFRMMLTTDFKKKKILINGKIDYLSYNATLCLLFKLNHWFKQSNKM